MPRYAWSQVVDTGVEVVAVGTVLWELSIGNVEVNRLVPVGTVGGYEPVAMDCILYPKRLDLEAHRDASPVVVGCEGRERRLVCHTVSYRTEYEGALWSTQCQTVSCQRCTRPPAWVSGSAVTLYEVGTIGQWTCTRRSPLGPSFDALFVSSPPWVRLPLAHVNGYLFPTLSKPSSIRHHPLELVPIPCFLASFLTCRCAAPQPHSAKFAPSFSLIAYGSGICANAAYTRYTLENFLLVFLYFQQELFPVVVSPQDFDTVESYPQPSQWLCWCGRRCSQSWCSPSSSTSHLQTHGQFRFIGAMDLQLHQPQSAVLPHRNRRRPGGTMGNVKAGQPQPQPQVTQRPQLPALLLS